MWLGTGPMTLLLQREHLPSLWWQWWVASLIRYFTGPSPLTFEAFVTIQCHRFLSREGHCFLCEPCHCKPPPAWARCAWMIYGSDCRGLLKPIQFQDSGSHFLSLTAHLMNSHYQLACFIIVRALIEVVVLKKKISKREKENKKKKVPLTHFVFKPLCPKLLGLSFAAPSVSLSGLLTRQTHLLHPLAQPGRPLSACTGPCILLVWVFSHSDGKSSWKSHFQNGHDDACLKS